MIDGKRDGYIRGATEQRSIDIAAFCDLVTDTYLGDFVDDEGYFQNDRLADFIRKTLESKK